ncbi:MAG TPA: ABC transporter permease [Dehalococcoidia bacterium]|nr:ABC transporter permease [Dehalococcoidia bacterium]
MQRYIMQRLILSLPTLIGVSILTFVGLRVILPQDVIDTIVGEFGRNDPQLRKNLERELGLSSSIPQQYLEYMGLWPTCLKRNSQGDCTEKKFSGVLQGNLGKSLHNGRSVTSEMKRRVPISFELGLWAQATAIAASVPMGVWAAVKQDKFPDYGLRTAAILLNAVPGFWIAVLVITFGSIWFNWAPPIKFKTLTEDPIAHLKIMATPALIIGLTPSGGLIRLVRTQMLEVLRQDYVRTAHAKGLSNATVFYKHALRNALIPVVTVIGVGLPGIIAGTVIFEQIFVIPGMGRYLVDSVNIRDYPVVQGLNLVFATLLIFSVLLVDISYSFLDPRIRYR